MTKENKELLLKDLCAKFPYGIKVHFDCCEPHVSEVDEISNIIRIKEINGYSQGVIVAEINSVDSFLPLDEIKPYLRPMSSMTEEEFTELKNYTELKYDQLELVDWDNTHRTIEFYLEEIPHYCVIKVFDWLNAHHFDYRGLIEKGLAFEAPEGMYKID